MEDENFFNKQFRYANCQLLIVVIQLISNTLKKNTVNVNSTKLLDVIQEVASSRSLHVGDYTEKSKALNVNISDSEKRTFLILRIDKT